MKMKTSSIMLLLISTLVIGLLAGCGNKGTGVRGDTGSDNNEFGIYLVESSLSQYEVITNHESPYGDTGNLYRDSLNREKLFIYFYGDGSISYIDFCAPDVTVQVEVRSNVLSNSQLNNSKWKIDLNDNSELALISGSAIGKTVTIKSTNIEGNQENVYLTVNNGSYGSECSLYQEYLAYNAPL